MKPRLGTVVAVVAGALFAAGLAVGGMTRPEKVIGFLDVTGAWDPSLAFVMAGAIAVHAPLLRWVRRRRAPLFGAAFELPKRTVIDVRLLGGAATFGAGWGLAGYCPGPALESLGSFTLAPLVFVGAMIVGVVLAGRIVPAAPKADDEGGCA